MNYALTSKLSKTEQFSGVERLDMTPRLVLPTAERSFIALNEDMHFVLNDYLCAVLYFSTDKTKPKHHTLKCKSMPSETPVYPS